MKIINIITSLGDGGAESTLFKIITDNKYNKHSITVISLMNEGKYGKKIIQNGINLITLDMPRGKLTIKGIIKLFKIIRFISPDIVQTWLYHADLIGGVISKILGIKKIFWNIRTSEYYSKNISYKTKFIIKLNSYLSYIIPQKIIYCSSRSIEIHERIGYAKKSLLIRNGFDPFIFIQKHEIRNQLRNKYKIFDSDFAIGFISRFDLIKNHKLLIETTKLIYKKNKNIKCILIGKEIKNNKSINAFLKVHNLYDAFILLEEKENISDYMNMLDLHVLPSNGEGFPNVVAETMCCGVLNISRDVGDAKKIILDDSFIFQNSIEELSKLILDMIYIKENKINKWMSLKEKARKKIIDNFSLDKMNKDYFYLWEN